MSSTIPSLSSFTETCHAMKTAIDLFIPSLLNIFAQLADSRVSKVRTSLLLLLERRLMLGLWIGVPPAPTVGPAASRSLFGLKRSS